jgi:NADPH-dependent ferric siderophore reductase
MNEKHTVTRIRHESRRRRLTVQTVERLTPNMVRVIFSGPDLDDFVSHGHDDHVKLLFPPGDAAGADGQEGPRPLMRDFTPRQYDTVARELTIDFALHDAGPASAWAARARCGQELEIGGPRGSTIIPDDFDGYLFVGDETALPAIGRRLEELRADTRAIVVAAIAGPAEEQQLRSAATLDVHWVHRPLARAADAGPLLSSLSSLALPQGDIHAWVAAEGGVAKALREHLLADRGLNRAWVKAAGYWRQGDAGAHESFRD